MKATVTLLISLLFLISCGKSSIRVQNNLPRAVLKNVEWGGVPLSSQLLPGETSPQISIWNDSYYDIDLPASHPLQFYLELNGDRIYLQTKMEYRLGKKQDLLIVVEDTTGVFNPLTVAKQ